MTVQSPEDLTPERALIFRITHLANLPWVMENGLHCPNSRVLDPGFIPIGDPDLIGKRTVREVPVGPGGALADYVPFYFTPWSPMQLNILTGRNVRKRRPEEIGFVVTSLPRLEAEGVRYLVSDRHAYLLAAEFVEGRDDLDGMVPWTSLQARDFRRDPDNPEAFDRYQAEALIHGHLPTRAIVGLACYTSAIKSDLDRTLAERGIELPTAVRPGWYFQ